MAIAVNIDDLLIFTPQALITDTASAIYLYL